jgi:cell wall-associated NlpC family hydrolase
MRRRLLSVLVLLACLGAAATAGAAVRAHAAFDRSLPWDTSEIATVVGHGLMGPSVEAFRPGDPLTWGELAGALAAWGHPIPAPADPARPVSIRDLDARLVAALDLLPASRAVRIAARDAGLQPVPSLGTETVARRLGLRINHEVPREQLELLPSQPATRAEAAYSFARALALTDVQKQQVLDETATLTPPALDGWQRTVLTRALRLVGYPYVFSGTSGKPEQTLWDGTVVPGGFDCSGFVWRVYKLQPFANAPALGQTLAGRTTYDMSGEVPATARIARADLQPADVVFFGSRGAASKPAEVGHMGIYLGNGWFVHASEHGVTLDPMTGWYDVRYAWARRPLAEAGLEGPGALALPPA